MSEVFLLLSCDVEAVSKLVFAVLQIVTRFTGVHSLERRISTAFGLKQQAIPAFARRQGESRGHCSS